ncbi:hypothetical protein TNCV_283121 [Trichonephila clavipes]|nr:hypothetical protein TNCV_283121 [Trichonephila clavipes]
MGKLPDLDAFHRGPIVDARLRSHSVSKIIRHLGFSRSTAKNAWTLEITRDRANCKERLTLTVRVTGGSSPTVYAVLISSRGNGVFQQDNCTSRNSRMVNGWLDEPFSDFSVINGPSRGPDLNPIEHLCVIFNKA